MGRERRAKKECIPYQAEDKEEWEGVDEVGGGKANAEEERVEMKMRIRGISSIT
jgi:hypothetical protein